MKKLIFAACVFFGLCYISKLNKQAQARELYYCQYCDVCTPCNPAEDVARVRHCLAVCAIARSRAQYMEEYSK